MADISTMAGAGRNGGVRSGLRALAAAAFGTVMTGAALAADGDVAAVAQVSGANVAWVLMASALVLFMCLPGLGLFYAGLVRARNVLSVLMHCFALCCVVSVLWAAFGYSLVFDGNGPWLGGLGKAFLTDLAPVLSNGLPENVFALFQMTFAVITPALIVGAFPERTPFGLAVAFGTLWTILVYFPSAHWLWGNGWLAAMGALDFAGGIVVHTTAGIAALVAAIMIGPRHGFPRELIPPHSPAMTMTGAGILWFGWFGFNGGSALAADHTAASAIIATHLAACAGAIAWTSVEWYKMGKPTSVGLVTGCIAGLATVTPAAGYVGPFGGVMLGLAGGVVCFVSVLVVKQRWLIDDSLDVFAVHGVGGMLGSLLLAVFATHSLGGNGLAEGMSWLDQLGVQALAVGVTAVWSGALTYAIMRGLSLFMASRISPDAEFEGLDITTHGERAYEVH